MSNSKSRLFPRQACFVVADVAAAAAEASRRFGWGPFMTFTPTFEDVEYRGTVATRVNEVALGMAGAVQVELVHVHEGFDCISTYQHRYGRGFQHLGIGCRSRDAAIERLESLGARLDESSEYAGVKIGFVDVPTGPGMFELLQSTSAEAGPKGEQASHEIVEPVVELDRATIVTANMDSALAFYRAAFDWENISATSQTLRYGPKEVRLRRAVGHAGLMELELLEGIRGSDDPYSAHLGRGEHGLIHAGAIGRKSPPGATPYQWLEAGESFELFDWAGGDGSLQLRWGETGARAPLSVL